MKTMDSTFHERSIPKWAVSGVQARMLAACVLALVSFLFTYIADNMRPGANYPLGWYSEWYDQTHYYNMLTHIRVGNLGDFQYPVVYPFLGLIGQVVAKLFHTYRNDPFFFVDLALFIIYVAYAHRVFERFLQPSLALVASLILIQTSVDLFVTPWTSTVSAASTIFAVDTVTSGSLSLENGILVGLASALSFGARIADAILVVSISCYSFIDRRNSWKIRKRFFAAATATGAIFSVVIVFVNFKFSGHLLGNYFAEITSQGFTLIGLPTKLYGYFIDPFTFHGEANPISRPILTRSLALLLAPLGLSLLMQRRCLNRPPIGPAFLIGLASWGAIYGPFVAITGLTLRYESQHYIKPILPLIVGAGLYVIQSLGEIDPTSKGHSGQNLRIIVVIYGAAMLAAPFVIKALAFPRLNVTPTMITSALNPKQLASMVDGDLQTSWDSRISQQPGMEFDVDLGRVRYVQRIVLDAQPSPLDYPRMLEILYSVDNKQWKSWAEMSANQSVTPSIVDIYNDPRPVRWLKFVQKGSDPNAHWAVHELKLYGW